MPKGGARGSRRSGSYPDHAPGRKLKLFQEFLDCVSIAWVPIVIISPQRNNDKLRICGQKMESLNNGQDMLLG